jgi:Domain of unknown function (DUF1772)
VLSVASTFFLGLLSGSLLVEALLFVPFWRALTPEEFFELHHQFGPRLFRYFAPLTAIAVTLPLVSAVGQRQGQHSLLRWIAAMLVLGVSVSFPLFFRKANDAFENRTVGDDELPGALQRWARVHAVRTVAACGAFLFSVLPLAL